MCSWRQTHLNSISAGGAVQDLSVKFVFLKICSSVCFPSCYLQRVLGADGQDLVLEVAELAAPRASLAAPADEAGLMGAAHGAVTAAGAQQLTLQDTQGKHSMMSLLENKYHLTLSLNS